MGEVEDKPVSDVFDPSCIPSLGNTRPFRWVTVPEWRNSRVCMWGCDLADNRAIDADARTGCELDTVDGRILFGDRRKVATILQCAHTGEPPDGKVMFDRSAWSWLESEPVSVTESLVNAVQELNMSSGIRADQVVSFFGIVGSLKSCLTSIASHCDACTDCPQNSRDGCLKAILGSLV